MDTVLHKQKIDLLSKLIKADHITLEEALMLLKEETQPVQFPSWTVNTPLTGPFDVIGGNTITVHNPYATTTTLLNQIN